MGESAKGRVLVVDDDEQLAGLLRVVLSSEGYDVALAANAATALERAREETFDLVVLDISLGEDDGRAVLAELHKTKEIPVIFISGLGDPADRVLGLRLGADDYLVKPFAPMELVARVGSVGSSRSGWQDEATVTEHMRRLRRKVEKDPEQPHWLKTVRGVGYRFEP